jgi:hypothetical protein
MSTYGPFHRAGNPGGPGCRVTLIPVQGKKPDGTMMDGSLLDAGSEAPEIELLRTVANGLGVVWGHDEFGWWAAVPSFPASKFAEASRPSNRHSLFREDDNGARFLIASFDSLDEAERKAAELAHGGHKQHYFIEPATDDLPPAIT